jgi:glycosyltransferase involved in cell wall biosynthesis
MFMDKTRTISNSSQLANKNKVCLFNSACAWGGGEKWHYDMAIGLSKMGREVIVIVNTTSELRTRLSHAGVHCIPIDVGNLSFLNPIKLISLIRLFSKENFGSIIINLSTDLKFAGIAAKIAGIKSIIYRRGSAIPIRNTLFNRFLFSKIITSVIANSLETRRTILARNPRLIDINKIDVIYNGIDTNWVENKKTPFQYKDSKDALDIVLGNCGRLSTEKGQILLIELASV